MAVIKKILRIMGLLIAFILIIVFILTPFKGVEFMKIDFFVNQKNLLMVTEYLTDLEFESIYIHSPDQTMSIGQGEKEVILEADINRAIRQLYRNGYKVIIKGANCIVFTRWNNLRNDAGTVYSIDGHIPAPEEKPLVELTKLQPLQENGWYYYEENYAEWRKYEQNGKKRMEEAFGLNRGNILAVTEYLVNSEFELISIPSDKTMFAGDDFDRMSIDADIHEEIIELFSNGYTTGITKNSNYVVFRKWNETYKKNGAIYSMDGNGPDMSWIKDLTKLEPMQESGWYYYEAE